MLSGRTALVTGGANGIGQAIVERFAAAGARVAAVDIEPVSDLGPAVVGFEFVFLASRVGGRMARRGYGRIVNELEGDWFRDIYVRHGKLPLRRYAEPAEIAAQVAWLASDQNTHVTGQVLTVDGGVTVTF